MLSKKTIVLATVCAILVFLSILADTNLLFAQSTLKPIRVYWKGETFPIPFDNGIVLEGMKLPNYSVSELDIGIADPFQNSQNNFMLWCDNRNYSFVPSLFIKVRENVYLPNETSIEEYKTKNSPDLMVVSPFIENGRVLGWVNLWDSGVFVPAFRVNSVTFLQKVSFDTFDASYVFEGDYSTLKVNNDSYANANVTKVVFTVDVPSNFQIENPEDFTISQKPSGLYSVSKSLSSGELFHLIVKDQTLEKIKSIFGLVSAVGIPATVLGLAITQWYERRGKGSTT